ncbi:MAG: flavohemoglobin expression-modulating QEGLA motif protein [Bdellovibrionota bacterium]
MSDKKLFTAVEEFSKALVEAQRPIQILDSIKWKDDIFEKFKKSNYKELPKIGKNYYDNIPLKFDAEAKIKEFQEIRSRIEKTLGKNEPIAKMLIRNCQQYEDVVRMLMSRATHDFYKYSKALFGSANDLLIDNKTSLIEAGVMLNQILISIENSDLGVCYIKNIPSEDVVETLNEKLKKYFGDTEVTVKLDDGILSDAAAGSNYIKIKRGLKFSQRDMDIFEVHEGWVHVGTTLNGMNQPYAKWLSKGPPCTTAVQEGLAFLMEVFTFVCTPDRLRKINNRLMACEMAESGASFLHIYDYFRNLNQTEIEAFKNAHRLFRGGVIEGGAPFTKDISYSKGFIGTYNFIRSAIRIGKPEMIPFLFAGKVTLEDVPVLYEYSKMGLIEKPTYMPPQFSDLNGIAVWMSFSNFLNKMNMGTISDIMKQGMVK